MGARFLYFFYLALNIYGRFPDHRRIDLRCLHLCQLHLRKFVHIFSRPDAAKICGMAKLLCRKIYYKCSAFFQHMIGITLRSHRDGYHRRIRTYGSCPGHGNDIIVSLQIPHADHHYRQRIEHISRFPLLFCHGSSYCCSAFINLGINCFFLDTTPSRRQELSTTSVWNAS